MVGVRRCQWELISIWYGVSGDHGAKWKRCRAWSFLRSKRTIVWRISMPVTLDIRLPTFFDPWLSVALFWHPLWLLRDPFWRLRHKNVAKNGTIRKFAPKIFTNKSHTTAALCLQLPIYLVTIDHFTSTTDHNLIVQVITFRLSHWGSF